MKLLKALLPILILIFTGYAKATEFDFFGNPAMGFPILTSSGKLIAYTAIADGNEDLMIENVKSGEKISVLYRKMSSKYLFGEYQWIDENTIAIMVNHSHREDRLFIKRITPDFTVENVATLDSVYLLNGLPDKTGTFLAGKYKYGALQIFKLDANKLQKAPTFASKKRINKGKISEGFWLTSSTGRVNVNFGTVDDEFRVYVKYGKSKKWKKVWSHHSEEYDVTPVHFIPEKKLLYLLTDKFSGYNEVHSYDVENKQFVEKVYSEVGNDISGILKDRFTGQLLGYTYLSGGVVQQIFDTPVEIQDEDVRSHFIAGANRERTVLSVISVSLDSPTEYFIRDTESGETRLIGKSRPGLDNVKLGVSESITSVSSDGTEIESYLTLPTLNTENNLPPMIVLPHGGPIGIRDTRHFSTQVHYLASKG